LVFPALLEIGVIRQPWALRDDARWVCLEFSDQPSRELDLFCFIDVWIWQMFPFCRNWL